MTRPKIILYFAEWSSTKGNHAGMAYLCKTLAELNENVIAFKIPEVRSFKSNIKLKGARKFNKYIDKYIFEPLYPFMERLVARLYAYYFFLTLKRSDNLFLMECLTPQYKLFQEKTALLLRKNKAEFNIHGMVHLSGDYIKKHVYNEDFRIKENLEPLTKIFVMGSSLKYFIENLGFENKVVLTFHYVDTDFYTPNPHKQFTKPLRVISMGFLQRDHLLLSDIIKRCPEVIFDVCMGRNNQSHLFKDFKNVVLYGYLDELQLSGLMRAADVSLNVMEDTIGSNVITTSLACGLAMIVSDVGSIRDYCNEANSIFCNNAQEFVEAILLLANDTTLLKKMSESAFDRAQTFSLANFNKSFIQQILNT